MCCLFLVCFEFNKPHNVSHWADPEVNEGEILCIGKTWCKQWCLWGLFEREKRADWIALIGHTNCPTLYPSTASILGDHLHKVRDKEMWHSGANKSGRKGANRGRARPPLILIVCDCVSVGVHRWRTSECCCVCHKWMRQITNLRKIFANVCANSWWMQSTSYWTNGCHFRSMTHWKTLSPMQPSLVKWHSELTCK